jgi:hypothetical protein
VQTPFIWACVYLFYAEVTNEARKFDCLLPPTSRERAMGVRNGRVIWGLGVSN